MANGNMITINGKKFPSPDKGLTFEVATCVDAGRNANMEFVGQKVGREQYKIDSLQWYSLDAETWSEFLIECEKFKLLVTFPDMVHNRMATLLMYPGNRTASPDPTSIGSNGMPKRYLMCKCNIVDCGVVS
ncbi:MAG: hypothetical protein QM644_18460 [Mobilitalea sp.]